MLAMLWVIPVSIGLGFACYFIMSLMGFVGDYNEMSTTSARTISTITGVLCFGTWFIVKAIVAGSIFANTWPWVGISVIILVIMSIFVGLLVYCTEVNRSN